jgi:hypothetical protein
MRSKGTVLVPSTPETAARTTDTFKVPMDRSISNTSDHPIVQELSGLASGSQRSVTVGMMSREIDDMKIEMELSLGSEEAQTSELGMEDGSDEESVDQNRYLDRLESVIHNLGQRVTAMEEECMVERRARMDSIEQRKLKLERAMTRWLEMYGQSMDGRDPGIEGVVGYENM